MYVCIAHSNSQFVGMYAVCVCVCVCMYVYTYVRSDIGASRCAHTCAQIEQVYAHVFATCGWNENQHRSRTDAHLPAPKSRTVRQLHWTAASTIPCVGLRKKYK